MQTKIPGLITDFFLTQFQISIPWRNAKKDYISQRACNISLHISCLWLPFSQPRASNNVMFYNQNLPKHLTLKFWNSGFKIVKFEASIYKIPWLLLTYQFSLTNFKIPWLSPDLEKIYFSLTFPWPVGALIHSCFF